MDTFAFAFGGSSEHDSPRVGGFLFGAAGLGDGGCFLSAGGVEVKWWYCCLSIIMGFLTLGDPLKDTSGPAVNIVMKQLTAILILVFGPAIADYSNSQGGPFLLNTS